jgi:hypothetical protein
MCSFTLSNPNTVIGLSSQLASKKALSLRRVKSTGLLLSMFLENFTKNWKCASAAWIFVAANLKKTRDQRALRVMMPGVRRRKRRR